MNNSLVILTPLYNDWGSLKILIKNIKKLNLQKKITLIIINDNSAKKSQILFKKDRSIIKIEIINLKENCGSQRAIAIGLNYLKIKKYHKKYKNYIITINRTFRTENFLIKILYELNIFFTILLTRKFIRFGNYSLIPNKIISKMNVSRDFWFSYPSAISNNYNNIIRIYAKKEIRYSGKSQMNYYQLIFHSLRIISTFKKRIFFNTLIYLTLIILFFMNNKTIIIISLFSFFLINIFFLYLYKFILRSEPDNYLCKIKNTKVINLI